MNATLKAKIVERFGHQWKFAEAVGMHESDISRVIHRNKNLSREKAETWARALDCDLKNLGVRITE